MRHHMYIPRVSWTVAAFGVASLILPLCISPAAFSEEPAASVKSNQEREHEHAHEHEHGELHDEFENIVVTATPLDHSPDEVATPVNQLDREEVLGRLRPTLGETLSNIPGISSSGFSAGASRPVIRGQDAFRTEVLEDGLSTQDVSRLSPDHAIPVNPLSSRSIEILRGPAVLRYGGGASAGVVNVLTNRIPSSPIAEPVTGELVGIWGSNEDQGDFSGLLEGGIGDFTWHADGLYRESDDYETGAGNTQDGTDTETWAASGGGAYHFDEGRVGFSYTRFDSEYGIPEDEPVLIDMRSNRYRFEGEWDGLVDGLREVRVRGVFSDYKHDEIADGEVGQTFDN